MNDDSATPKPRHPGIYLLPNLFTTMAMMAGFYAIVSAFNGRFTEGAIAVFVAGVLDGLDGRVARMTNTQSDFGVQYDSLADLVSFGVAPALVMYAWALSTLKAYGPMAGKFGWAVAFAYTACAAMRLARFNTQVGVVDKRYFQGLASPASAALMMSFVWAMNDAAIPGSKVAAIAALVTLVAGALMVSRFRYWSFKTKPEGERVPFIWIPIAMAVLVLLVIHTPRMLFVLAVAYVIHGPLLTLLGMRKRRMRPG